jgi:hypothetical protein
MILTLDEPDILVVLAMWSYWISVEIARSGMTGAVA